MNVSETLLYGPVIKIGINTLRCPASFLLTMRSRQLSRSPSAMPSSLSLT
jgi:hypothetical protein